jgi:hypothetical protein
MSDPGLLEAALEGLQIQKQRIETQIEEVKGALGKRRTGSPVGATETLATETPKRQLSEAARKRIAAAQKKRWAEYRKAARHNGSRAVKREATT